MGNLPGLNEPSDSTIFSRYLVMKFPRWTASRALAWVAVAMVMAGCQAPAGTAAGDTSPTPKSISLQPGDVPGMQRCAISGDVINVLGQEKATGSPAYAINATEWAQWKQQGATDAYFAVYGRTASDCAAASDSSTGAPTSGVMVGLVVQFHDTSGAARNFERESTLMGLGPKNIRFIELAGGTTTFGNATGLGHDSVVGSADVVGTNYFMAEWQSSRFQSELMGYDMAYADADNAVMEINRRIVQH